MQILITGGAGFIGSNLAELHLKRGDEVRAVDDLSTGRQANIDELSHYPAFGFERADIVSWAGMRDAVRWADRVYHLAAVVGVFRVLNEPIAVTRVNVIGCERLLEAVATSEHRPQVLLASTSSVYGSAPASEMYEDATLQVVPGSPLLGYAASKLVNEVQAQAYAEKHGVRVVAARLFNTVGRRQSAVYGFVIPRFVQQALAGAPMTLFGDGEQTRSFCDVRDTVAMLDLLASTADTTSAICNVGNASEITIRALAERIRAHVGSDSPLHYVSYAEAYGKVYDQIPQRRPNLARLQARIGYTPRHTLDDSIEDLTAWYREHGRAAAGLAQVA